MTEQVFLQGKLLGIEQFVLAAAESGDGKHSLAGRSDWVTLLMETLPRALLAELGLPAVLLGASGCGGFLLLLSGEFLAGAESILTAAASDIDAISGGRLRLVWAATDNLGEWPVVRRRLTEELWRRQNITPAAMEEGAFAPKSEAGRPADHAYLDGFAASIREAASAGWSPDTPGRVIAGAGKHVWPLGHAHGALPFARHTALTEDGSAIADLATLARRAEGRPAWGVLRGDVDSFGAHLRAVNAIEDHIRLSVLYKQFFAGELEVACSLPEFWRKVSILYAGGDDFAVYGSWDALLMLAREIHRLFTRFVEENLSAFTAPGGKTLTMALETAPEIETPFPFVYEEAGRNLEAAKCGSGDALHLFGVAVEWKHIAHANGLKDTMLRMVSDFRCAPGFLEELGGFYREKPSPTRPDRPWRYHRRFGVALGANREGFVGAQREKELQKLRTSLLSDLIGRSPSQVKLRPAGLAAVAWARMAMET